VSTPAGSPGTLTAAAGAALAAFVTARVADDQPIAELAREACLTRGWNPRGWASWVITSPARGEVHTSPDRALAECAAKRAAVTALSAQALTDPHAAAALRALAAVYRDHPDHPAGI
jgi:hypothetical protein